MTRAPTILCLMAPLCLAIGCGPRPPRIPSHTRTTPGIVVPPVDPARDAGVRLAHLVATLRAAGGEVLVGDLEQEMPGPAIAAHRLALRRGECVVAAAASDSTPLALVLRDSARPALDLEPDAHDATWRPTVAAQLCAARDGAYLARVHARSAGIVRTVIVRTPGNVSLADFRPRPHDALAMELAAHEAELEARGYAPLGAPATILVEGSQRHPIEVEAGRCYAALSITEAPRSYRFSVLGGADAPAYRAPRVALVRFCAPDDGRRELLVHRGSDRRPARHLLSLHRWTDRVRRPHGVPLADAMRIAETDAVLALEGFSPVGAPRRGGRRLEVHVDGDACHVHVPIAQWSEGRQEDAQLRWVVAERCPSAPTSFELDARSAAYVRAYRRPRVLEGPPLIASLTVPESSDAPGRSWVQALLELGGYGRVVPDARVTETLEALARGEEARVEITLDAGQCHALALESETPIEAWLDYGEGRVHGRGRQLALRACVEADVRATVTVRAPAAARAGLHWFARPRGVASCDPMPPMGPVPQPRTAPEWAGRDAPVREQVCRANGFVWDACVGRNQDLWLRSYARYVSWADPIDGPPPDVDPPSVLRIGDGAARCAEAARAARSESPALPELEAAAGRYAAALTLLEDLLTDADRYYSRGHHRDDAMAHGRSLHPLLIDAYGAVACAQETLGRDFEALSRVQARQTLDELRSRPDERSRYLALRALVATTDVLTEAGDMTISFARLSAPNLAEYDARVRELEIAVNDIQAHEACDVRFGWSIVRARATEALRAALDLSRRVRRAEPYTAEELQRRRGQIPAAPGSFDELVSHRRALAEAYGGLELHPDARAVRIGTGRHCRSR